MTNETTAPVQAADAPAELPVTGRRDVVRRTFGILRIAAGLLVLAGIATQIIDEILHDAFKPDEYFSYFTIETSLINIVVLLVGGVLALRARWDSGLFTSIRMSIVTYATVTAAVYAVLLRPIPPVGYVGPQWPNEVIHVIVPIFIGLDWLLAPGRPALAWKSMLVAISYPVAWLAFTLLRGILTGWVPYPFLEPDGPGVWGGVLQYVLGIAAFIIAVAAVAITISRASQRRGVKSERPPFL